jgi:hypothetical protein
VAILIRPVREQLEHDRVIRALQAKNRRKFEVTVNLGEDRTAPVKLGPQTFYPDLVYLSTQTPKKVQGVVEVETGESVNGLEAKAQWANFGRVRAPFHLYVPVGSVDAARRLCEENQVALAELWSYVTAGEEVRFALVQRSAVPAARGNGRTHAAPAAARAAKPAPRTSRPAAGRGKAAKPVARPAPKKAVAAPKAKKAAPKKARKPVARKPAAKAARSQKKR